MRCFVPNCANENITGLNFPQDDELRNTWLRSLHIYDVVPDSSSIVCLDHFKKSDVEEIVNENGVLERKVNPSAVPRLFELDKVIEKETEEFLEFKNQKFGCEQNDENNEDKSQEKTVFEPQFPQFNENDFILNDPAQLYQNSQNQETGVGNENQDFLKNNLTSEQVYTAENQQVVQVFTSEEQTEPSYIPVQTEPTYVPAQIEPAVFIPEESVPAYNPEEPLIINENDNQMFNNPQTIPNMTTFQLENEAAQSVLEDSMDETHENIAKMVAEHQPSSSRSLAARPENLVQNDQSMESISSSTNDEGVVESAENIVMQWFVPNNNVQSDQDNSLNSSLNEKDKITITYQKEIDKSHVSTIEKEIGIGEKSENVSLNFSGRFDTSSESTDDLCRLCNSKEAVTVNILDNIKDNIMVLEAIQSCLHPLEISLEDPFSKKICQKCLDVLRTYFEFRQNCIKIDVEHKRSYEKTHPQHKFTDKKTNSTNIKQMISPNEKSYKQGEVVRIVSSESKDYDRVLSKKIVITPAAKKKYSEHHVRNTNDKHDDKSVVRQIITTKKSDNIQVYKVKNKENGSYYRKIIDKRPAVPIRISSQKLNQSQLDAIAKKPPLPTSKQMRIQEELKKVIEGKMSKNDLSVDHVIVRVVSDDESEDNTPPKRQKISVPIADPKKNYNRMQFGTNEILIPKSIRVSIPEKYESNKGYFPVFTRIGMLSNEFAVVDGYLFEHGIRRGNERNLKCISTGCPAMAVQKAILNGRYETRAFVKTPHNHHQPTNAEMKKQMCYYVMKKKLTLEKGTNFRNIYDQICQKDPEMRELVPLKALISELCKSQYSQKLPTVKSFEEFFDLIETDTLSKLQFTCSGKQFFQDKFIVEDEGSKAIVFANAEIIKKVSKSKLMYVDASFRINPGESCPYQLVTVLVWIEDCYYPIMFALVNSRTMEIFKKIFTYLHDTLAPNLRPEEIVTDYEANIYYALGETYLDSHIGGSVFYYTQNLYKKICELGLSKELEATPYFRHIYHMLLMLPLLPVNTIPDGLHNIEVQAHDIGVIEKTEGLFKHVKEQWMGKVTPDLFCVHRLENRINENVLSPFKKLRDYLLIAKTKTEDKTISIVNVVEKLIELEHFLQTTYSSEKQKSFGRDLSSLQKKNVMKAWQYIETHPKININHFFLKVVGYIKCMENQLWIWGYYKFSGKVTDDLINASNFSIENTTSEQQMNVELSEDVSQDSQIDENSAGVHVTPAGEEPESTVVVEAVVGPSGEFVISNQESNQEMDNPIFNSQL